MTTNPSPSPRSSRILGLRIDRVTLAEAVARCLGFVAHGGPHLVVTPNAEIANAALQDAELRRVLADADLVVPDGVGVVLAARLLGDPVPAKVAGVELAAGLLQAVPTGTRVYLLGASRASVAAAACHLVSQYPQVTVVGYRDGYWEQFDPAADAEVIQAVKAAAPHVLFVGLGAPKQEKWLHRHLSSLAVPVSMAIGGGIDLWSGRSPRAPQWLRGLHLEWLYRIVRFRRFRRLGSLLAFALRVVAYRLTHGARPPSKRGS